MQNPATRGIEAFFMRNQKNDFSFRGFFAQTGKDFFFRIRIQSTGGFIKNENSFIGKESTCQGNALLLTAGQVISVSQDRRGVTVIAGIYERCSVGEKSSGSDGETTISGIGCPTPDVFCDGGMKQIGKLRYIGGEHADSTRREL